MSFWNFPTSQPYINKSDLNILENKRTVVSRSCQYKFFVALLSLSFKKIKFHDSIVRLVFKNNQSNLQNFGSLLHLSVFEHLFFVKSSFASLSIAPIIYGTVTKLNHRSIKANKKIWVWGYILKIFRVGRNDFFFTFLTSFFSIQRTYGTLKQNLVKFKYTQDIN